MTSYSKARRRACGDGDSPVPAPSAFRASCGRRRRSTRSARARSTSELSWSPAANPSYLEQTLSIYGLAYRACGFGGLQPPRPTSSDHLHLTRCNLRFFRKVLRRRSGAFAVSGQAFRGGRVKRNSSRMRGMSMLPQHRAVNCAPLGGNAPWITLIPRVSRNSATGTKSRSEDTSTATS